MAENQTGDVSNQGTPSTEGEVSKETTPQAVPEPKPEDKDKSKEAQPLTQEHVNQMIKDALAEQETAYKRQLQSVNDKAEFLKGKLTEIEPQYRRTKAAAEVLQKVKSRLKEVDPDLDKDVEIAELRTENQHHQEQEQQTTAQQQAAAFDTQFHTQMTQRLQGLDIDPKDKRVDWGTDAKDYLSKMDRILTSAEKIIKERGKAVEDKKVADEKEIEARIEARLRKQLGLDTVDTSTPASSVSDDDFLARYGRGEVDDHKKAREILNKKKSSS